MSADGSLHSVDVHLDADDPNFTFIDPVKLRGVVPRRIVNAYNAPYRRSNRLRIRRATDFRSIFRLLEAHYDAADVLRSRGII